MRDLYRLTDHVYISPFDPSDDENATDMPNLGYIKGENKSLLYDVGTGPKQLNKLFSDLDALNLRRPDLAIISHYHWDHSFGANYVGCPCYSTDYTFDKLKKMKLLKATNTDSFVNKDFMPLFCKEHMRKEYNDSCPDIKLPEAIIDWDTTIDLGNLIVEIKPIINPHCLGSLLLYVPKDQVVFVADATSGYIIDYDFYDDFPRLKVLYNTIKELDCKYVVTGHSNVVSKRDYLDSILEKVK